MSAQAVMDELSDECWLALRPALFRRAVLGKRRCTQLVMMTLAQMNESVLAQIAPKSASDRTYRTALTGRVEAAYRDTLTQTTGTYDAVMRTAVLPWAVKAIVAWIVTRWQDKRFSLADIRKHYRWP